MYVCSVLIWAEKMHHYFVAGGVTSVIMQFSAVRARLMKVQWLRSASPCNSCEVQCGYQRGGLR